MCLDFFPPDLNICIDDEKHYVWCGNRYGVLPLCQGDDATKLKVCVLCGYVGHFRQEYHRRDGWTYFVCPECLIAIVGFSTEEQKEILDRVRFGSWPYYHWAHTHGSESWTFNLEVEHDRHVRAEGEETHGES